MKELFILIFKEIWSHHLQNRNLKSMIRFEYQSINEQSSIKSHIPNWSEEVFIIDNVQYTNPITYKIKDLNNEEIKGSFMNKSFRKPIKQHFELIT